MEGMKIIVKSHNRKWRENHTSSLHHLILEQWKNVLWLLSFELKTLCYNWNAKIPITPDKLCLISTERKFKKMFYKYKISFNNRGYTVETHLFKYICKIKKHIETPTLKLSFHFLTFLKNIYCVFKRKGIISYQNLVKISQERLKRFSKYFHNNKVLLYICKPNDWFLSRLNPGPDKLRSRCRSGALGRAKPLGCAQFFGAHTALKTLDLQVFSGIGKTMKKLKWILNTTRNTSLLVI